MGAKSVRVQEPLYDQLVGLAKRDGRSVTSYLNRVIESHVKSLSLAGRGLAVPVRPLVSKSEFSRISCPHPLSKRVAGVCAQCGKEVK